MGQKEWRDGGDEGIRTPDLLLAKQALSQLSYTPGRQNSDQQSAGLRLSDSLGIHGGSSPAVATDCVCDRAQTRGTGEHPFIKYTLDVVGRH